MEVWKCLGEVVVDVLTGLLNKILERVRGYLRNGGIFKKRDMQSKINYSSIKLMSHNEDMGKSSGTRQDGFM